MKRSLIVLATSLVVALLAGCASREQESFSPFPQATGTGAAPEPIHLPNNQALTPAGLQIDLPWMRPQVLALSPDGKLLATSGKTHELVLLDPDKGTVLQRVALPSEKAGADAQDNPSSPNILKPDSSGQASYTGLVFSPDGSRVFLSNVNGSIKVFAVDAANRAAPLCSFPLPPTGLSYRKKDIPSGLAISADGKRIYVALNVSNRLLEMDARTGKTLRLFDAGTAPYAVALNRGKAYVSNWGGRRPTAETLNGPIGIGALVRVDPARFIASEGSVSVIDLKTGKATREILTGMHACGMALSPNRRYLTVANANSDIVSVIDTRSDRVVETIPLRWDPSDPFGASPNALAFDRHGRKLYVCNGTQNAVAVISFRPGKSKLAGLIPTGWFPGAIVSDARRGKIDVANIKGKGSARSFASPTKKKFSDLEFFGTVSLIAAPDGATLALQTRQALRNYQRARVLSSLLPPRPDVPPRAVPERVGEPSLIKHVIYIVKENRTYDQVLGDMPEGNGDASLCIFGEGITPNQHKLCREFVLLDNTHCSGIVSADGHQWADTAFATDYMEKSFAGFPRSYPDGMEKSDVDALAYAPTGFIWDNAREHGKTLRDYGEFTMSACGWRDHWQKAAPTFLDYYRDFTNASALTKVASVPAIGSLEGLIDTNTVGWSLDVPDVVRAAEFIRELRGFETNGTLPSLILICLPNDHTSGTRPLAPTPAAHVADNDLALGRIVEAVSHSRFWKDTCIFAIEDDPQSGWDHASGYRTTAYVISPYIRRHAVVSEDYNQTSLLRTMELMLGLPPMNQMDASATPMAACFTNNPDLTPYDSVPNRVPLDQLNPPLHTIRSPEARKDAVVSARLPLDAPDRCPDDLLNRILWRSQMGARAPYPAWAVDASVEKDRD